MKNGGEKLSLQTIVENILRSLASRFEHVVVIMEESKDVTITKIEEI